jgi:hypothetical protein
MNTLMRCALQLLLPLAASAACHAASPYDTPGPFVDYSLDGTTRHFVPGNSWVQTSGPSSPTGQISVQGAGDYGIAKIGMAGSGTFNGYAWSGWSDTITVQAAPGVNATQGTLTFNLQYAWNAQVSGQLTNTAAFADVNLIGGPVNQYALVSEEILQSCTQAGQCGGLWTFGQHTSDPIAHDGAASFSFTVNFGQPYVIAVGMNVQMTGQDATAIIDATHSVHWGGITSVSVDSQAIGYQVTSSSGMNYVAAVPETATPVLMLVGLLALAGYSARRSRRAQV